MKKGLLVIIVFLYSHYLLSQGVLDRSTYKANQSTLNVIAPEKKKLDEFYKKNPLPIGKKIKTFPTLTRQDGKPSPFKNFLNKPLILNIGYLDCPAVCNFLTKVVLENSSKSGLTIGKDFNLVSISFLHSETIEQAQKKKKSTLSIFADKKIQKLYEKFWHIYVGDKNSLEQLFGQLKYKFIWSEKRQEYFHPILTYIITSDGVVSQIIDGFSINPQTIKYAILKAQKGTLSNFLQKALVFCYRYDPESRQYVLAAQKIMSIVGLITLIIVLFSLALLWRREIKDRKKNKN